MGTSESEILEKLMVFCDPEYPSYTLPFTDGTNTYATDGHVIVRVPGVLVTKDDGPVVSFLPWRCTMEEIRKSKVIELSKEDFEALRTGETTCIEHSPKDEFYKSCSTCDGTLWNLKAVYHYEGCYLAARLLSKLLRAYQSILLMFTIDVDAPVQFICAEADGFIMPMRSEASETYFVVNGGE